MTKQPPKLTSLQHHVVFCNGTEPPFQNEFWNHHEPGLYVDVVTGEPLFASIDKFDSGSGWPSFTKTINADVVVEHVDESHGMVRTEVRSGSGESSRHLGHVFDDGPNGMPRYCINSAALRFVHKDQLQAEGYGAWLKLFV